MAIFQKEAAVAGQDALRDLVKDEVKMRVKKAIKNELRVKRAERVAALESVVDYVSSRIADSVKGELSIENLSPRFTHYIETGAYSAAERIQYDELVKDAQRLAQPAIEEAKKLLSEAVTEAANEAIYEVIDEILKAKKPHSRLIDSLAEQYSAIAFKFGYYEAQSPCWLYFMRKDGTACAFEVQFGNVSEFKVSLERLNKSGAQICVFVTSSLAHTMRLEAVRGLLLKNFQIKNQKYLLVDIETGRALKVNFEWDEFEKGMSSEEQSAPKSGKPLFREVRRKKIYGKRGQHKEQD